MGEKVYLKDVYGRIRAITSDNKGNVYIATSNRDWKPQTDFPKEKDDRILKLSKLDFVPDRYLEEEKLEVENTQNGQLLYKTYCASCHMLDGKGGKGVFPSLSKSSRVQDKNKLVDIILRGIQQKKTIDGAEYSEMMPSFSFLSNKEIAQIATYIRDRFDNNYSSVECITVQENR